jgi:NAD(P)-dependent dehydrogenase (short-subunit alcohol dehydrogenase family)
MHLVWIFVVSAAAATGTTRAGWPGSCKSTETADDVLTGIDLKGKIFIITGADGHIAEQVGLSLAKKSATLVLACRSVAKCTDVKDSIQNVTGDHGRVFVGALDLSSAKSIADFAGKIEKAYPQGVHALVNSAGTYSTTLTKDGQVLLMAVNLLGPAKLTDLLLPSLRGRGRVVNVAAATYGLHLPENTTVDQIASWCTKIDPVLNATGKYFGISKYLMTHHAIELAKREPTIAAFAVNPGVAFLPYTLPQWLVRFPFPQWILKRLPSVWKHIHDACTTNEAGLARCPEIFDNSAAVVAAAAAWPNIESYSGSYLDFDTEPLPPDAPQVYGPFVQHEPSCQPREAPSMDARLRSAWYDEMPKLMRSLPAEERLFA